MLEWTDTHRRAFHRVLTGNDSRYLTFGWLRGRDCNAYSFSTTQDTGMNALRFLPAAPLLLAFVLGTAYASDQATADAQQVMSKTVTENGTITAINADQRLVTVRSQHGNDVTVRAGDEVQNFRQLRVGNTVTLIHHRGVVVDLQPAGDTNAPGAYIKEDESRAPDGTGPGGAHVETVTVLAPIVAIDIVANTLSVKDPHGRVKVLNVAKPENQQKLAELKVGDVLRVRFIEGTAISINPYR